MFFPLENGTSTPNVDYLFKFYDYNQTGQIQLVTFSALKECFVTNAALFTPQTTPMTTMRTIIPLVFWDDALVVNCSNHGEILIQLVENNLVQNGSVVLFSSRRFFFKKKKRAK